VKDVILYIPVKLTNVSPLKRLLDSLERNQFFKQKNFGVVIVDDGSPGNEVKMLCDDYPVVYLRTKGVGKMAALNYGVRKTKSKYVLFTDQDNIIVSSRWVKTLLSNFTNPNIGYVSGKVILYQGTSEAQRKWEKKGALNKGNNRLELGNTFYKKFRFRGVPVNICTAGSNHVMPRVVLEKIGWHDERFGPGTSVEGAGGDLDITYRVLRAGYSVIYDPRAEIGHEHPKDFLSLRQKMFSYGISDTAIHLKFLIEFGDIRSFFQVFYRIGQNASRWLRSFIGSYPLPSRVAFASILGNFVGLFKYFEVKNLPKGRGIIRKEK